MTIELAPQIESALTEQASARGMPLDTFVQEVLTRQAEPSLNPEPARPLKSGYGMWAKFGISLSEEDIDENRADMLRGSIFDKDIE
jgi:hypothetical protein